MIDKFILKMATNEIFGSRWFPKREIIGHNLRKDIYYHEEFAKNNRLYNSPTFFYRRRLNVLLIAEEIP